MNFSQTYSCPFEGRHRWFQVTAASAAESGRPGAVVMHMDVTGLERDALTGLANRVLFDVQAAYMLDIARQRATGAAILLMDLNDFKLVNDRFGHLAGDYVLRHIATTLRAEVREGDVPARFGGDEFGVVLASGTDRAMAGALVNRIRHALRKPIDFKTNTLHIGASVGAAIYPDDGLAVSDLLAVADARMYGMKHGRRLTA